MGIQGLLQALKPYVEPVHVSKYSGKRVGIDAYSWLHKGAYSCTWEQLREADTGQSSEKLPSYVTYCMHRIKMLLYNNITPVVVFDGGPLPLKALTEQNRRRLRGENVQKAEQKLAEGDMLSAQNYFQQAVEITPSMAHGFVKVLRDEQIEYVVAPYEADAQLAHLSTLAPEEGGVSAIITEDSDLLAYGCKVVLFKMDKFGNGEELCLDRMLQSGPPPANGMSFRNFNEDLFLAMCILAGCDFLASIPGIGVKKAHALLAEYRNVDRVLSKLKFLKHSEFPDDYIRNFWQAKALFKHARVYEKKTRSLKHLNPLPDELLKEFDGDTEFLGPDLPQSRARAIAIGQLDPTTMCSFNLLPKTTRTPFSMSKRADMEFIQAQKREFREIPPEMEPLSQLANSVSEGSFEVLPNTTRNPFSTSKSPEMEFFKAQKRGFLKIPEMKSLQPLATSIFKGSQVSSRSYTESTQVLPVTITETGMQSGTSQSVISSISTEVDEEFFSNLKSTACPGSHQQSSPEITAVSQVNRHDVHECGMSQDIPNNNPFRSQHIGQTLEHPNILSLPQAKLEPKQDNSGPSAENDLSRFFSFAEDSQQPSTSGEGLTSELTSLHWSSSSARSPEPEVAACCTPMDHTPSHNESLARVKRLRCSNCEGSQSSSNSCNVCVLADISPNLVFVSPENKYPTIETPSSAPLLKNKDPPFGRGGKMGSAKSTSRLKKSKLASHVDRRNFGSKRSRGSLEGSEGSEGSILRFFKPVPTPKKLTLEL